MYGKEITPDPFSGIFGTAREGIFFMDSQIEAVDFHLSKPDTLFSLNGNRQHPHPIQSGLGMSCLTLNWKG